MEPTIHCSIRLRGGCEGKPADILLQRESGALGVHRGDVIAFRLPRSALPYCDIAGITVKRVLALGGDRVVERDGLIWLNGRRLLERYVPIAERGHHSGRWTVPRGSFFVAGDNRAVSCDSRYWGSLASSRIQGKIIEIIRAGGAGADPVGPPIVHVRYPEHAYVMPSAAMEPTIHCKRPGHLCEAWHPDLVLEQESGSKGIRRQDLVGFRLPARGGRLCGGRLALERVIGLPGERVTERRGTIYIDGKQLEEPYIPERFRDTMSGSWSVPKGSYFVMADFRAHSCDSRFWGPLPASRVQGRVVEIFRPSA
jgi:signal peptidase I